MDGIRRIIAAVDFSVYSSQVLEYSAWVAEQTSAEIIAVSVINKRMVDSVEKVFNRQHPGMFSREKFLHDETNRRTKQLKDLVADWIPDNISVRVKVSNGVPFEKLISAVIDDEADLIVLAPKGRTDLADRLFGTTAEKVFRHAPVSVLSLTI